MNIEILQRILLDEKLFNTYVESVVDSSKELEQEFGWTLICHTRICM